MKRGRPGRNEEVRVRRGRGRFSLRLYCRYLILYMFVNVINTFSPIYKQYMQMSLANWSVLYSQVCMLETFQVPVGVHSSVTVLEESCFSQHLRTENRNAAYCCFISADSDTKLPDKSTFPCLPIHLCSYISRRFGKRTAVGLYNRTNMTAREKRLNRNNREKSFASLTLHWNDQSRNIQNKLGFRWVPKSKKF